MNQKKIDNKKRGLTALAKKVYACVPITEEWDKSKIHAEMRRNGSTQSVKAIDGCLNSLVQTGLIKEVAPARFIQITASRPAPEVKKKQTLRVVDDTPAEKTTLKDAIMPKDPLEIMQKLNVKMQKLTDAMDELRGEFDNTALEMAECLEKYDKDLEKLRMFQQLMKED